MASIRSELLMARFRLTGRKRTWTDTAKLDRSIRRLQRPGSGMPPDNVREKYAVRTHDIGGFACHTVSPQTGAGAQQILYLHGGAYVHPIESGHWSFIGRLVETLGASVHVANYPLAPRHQYDETLAMVTESYERLVAPADPSQQVIMGDSAGGGMTLVLAQELKAEQRPQPRHLVLISPWLDITMTDPAIPTIDRRDPYLSPPGLLEAGRLYSGTLDPRDSRVSPLNGDLDGLGRLSVFIGTRDVLFPDARRLWTLTRQAGIEIGYFEYEDMFHAWVLQNVPEAFRATRQVTEILRH